MKLNFRLFTELFLISSYALLFSCQSSDTREEKTKVAVIEKLKGRTATLPATWSVPDSVTPIPVVVAQPKPKITPKSAIPLVRTAVTTKMPASPKKPGRSSRANQPDMPKQKQPVNRVNLKTAVNFSQGLPKSLKKQVSTSYGFSIDKEMTWKGQAFARFELRPEDVKNGVVRSEILLNSDKEPEAKYGWVMFFPEEFWQPSKKSDIVMQLHGYDDKYLGEKARNPQFALYVYNDRLKVTIHHSELLVNTNDTDTDEKFDLGPLPKDKFLEMVLEIRHSFQSDGYAKLFINGKQVLDYKGATSYNDIRKYPYFKAGIYNHSIKFDRVVYISNIRHGNSKSSYKDVTP